MTDLFWIDAEYDREAASDGVSRYGAYVRDGSFEPWTDDDRHVELAVFAWHRATTPVMSPGYVRRHHRILTAQLARSDWDGSLIAQVDLVVGQPERLRYLSALQPYSGGLWRDWPSQWSFSGDHDVFYEPGTEDIARAPYLLVSLSLRFTVPAGGLPQPGPLGADAGTCQRSVSVMVRELNAIVGPVIDRIEGS